MARESERKGETETKRDNSPRVRTPSIRLVGLSLVPSLELFESVFSWMLGFIELELVSGTA